MPLNYFQSLVGVTPRALRAQGRGVRAFAENSSEA